MGGNYGYDRTITRRRKSDNWNIVSAVLYVRRDLTTRGSPTPQPRIVNDFVHTVCLKLSYVGSRGPHG